jgi:hypothetical protein
MMIALVDSTFAEEINHWTVVPATQNPLMNAHGLMFAWRIDNQTGALEMCTYDPGGWLNIPAKKQMPESLKCTPANMPSQH